ncbi:hypothetical protein [Paenibacillus aestuarii]|uniref:Transposase TnpC homeodomain domain-containing protein n=1 Tax=Paenibacillus aestuarii TaxID=516965 RepID=A0ABW0K1K3_9BACL|nr:hypothetical protein [Paenibacillus aestuarii]
MNKEELLTRRELNALLAAHGEGLRDLASDEPIGAEHLMALQRAVLLLAGKVHDLQAELHEQMESQRKQQEELLRLFKQQYPDTEPGEETPLSENFADTELLEESPPPTYSRVKSYRKIRKRRKTFLEKLFD